MLACRDQYYWWSAVDQTRLLVLVCIVVFGKCVSGPCCRLPTVKPISRCVMLSKHCGCHHLCQPDAQKGLRG